MNNVLEGSLFVNPNKKFDEIQSIIRQFSAEYGQKQTNPRRVAQRQSTVGLNSPSIFICCSFLWVKTELPKAT